MRLVPGYTDCQVETDEMDYVGLPNSSSEDLKGLFLASFLKWAFPIPLFLFIIVFCLSSVDSK